MDNGFLLFVLAVAVGVVGGALAHQWAFRRSLSDVARFAAMVAGFIVGFALVYIVNAHV